MSDLIPKKNTANSEGEEADQSGIRSLMLDAFYENATVPLVKFIEQIN